jgi:hypothetical protein
MSSVSGVSGSTGGVVVAGGPGQAKSIIEGTIAENQKMAAWYQAPIRIPDTTKMFPIGGNVNLTA